MQTLALNVVTMVGLLLVVAYLVVEKFKSVKSGEVKVVEKKLGVSNEELATVVRGIQTSFSHEISKLNERIVEQEKTIDIQHKTISALENRLVAFDLRCKQLEDKIDRLEDRISQLQYDNNELRGKIKTMEQTLYGYDKTRLQRVK